MKWCALGLLLLLWACERDALEEPAPVVDEPVAHQPVQIEPAVIPAIAPSPAPVDPFTELLTGAPSAEMLDAKAYILDPKPRIGVYFGMPEGWRYDDPSYLSITPVGRDAPGRFAVLRLSEPGLAEANLAKLLKRGPLPAQIAQASWEPWRAGLAGAKRWPAKIARGEGTPVIKTHGELALLAAVIDVPDTPAVGVMAAWPKAQPELEARMIDIVRHLHRCKVRVGHGCVPEG